MAPTRFDLHLYIVCVVLNALAIGYGINPDTASWSSQIVTLHVVLMIANTVGLVYGCKLVYGHMKAVRHE